MKLALGIWAKEREREGGGGGGEGSSNSGAVAIAYLYSRTADSDKSTCRLYSRSYVCVCGGVSRSFGASVFLARMTGRFFLREAVEGNYFTRESLLYMYIGRADVYIRPEHNRRGGGGG